MRIRGGVCGVQCGAQQSRLCFFAALHLSGRCPSAFDGNVVPGYGTCHPVPCAVR